MAWARCEPFSFLAADDPSLFAADQLFLGLVRADDETGEPLPELATTWAMPAGVPAAPAAGRVSTRRDRVSQRPPVSGPRASLLTEVQACGYNSIGRTHA